VEVNSSLLPKVISTRRPGKRGGGLSGQGSNVFREADMAILTGTDVFQRKGKIQSGGEKKKKGRP